MQKNNFNLIVEIIKKLPAKAQALIVGGAVRDMLLNLNINDLDIEIYGLELNELKEFLANFGVVREVGKSFGILKIDGIDADWSIPRTDSIGRKPLVKLEPNMSHKEAFSRRDLTINAIGFDPIANKIIDCFNGQEDLRNKKLQAVSNLKFAEDPLRVLRVMQMISRFEMQPTAELSKICSNIDLKDLSTMRFKSEFDKLFSSGKPSLGLRWLYEIGQMAKILPEINSLANIFIEYKNQRINLFELAMQTIDITSILTFNLNFEQRRKVLWASLFQYFKLETSLDFKKCLSRITEYKKLAKEVELLIKYSQKPFELITNNLKIDYLKLAAKINPESLNDLGLIAKAKSLALNNLVYTEPKSEIDIFLKKALEFGVLHRPIEPILKGKDFYELGYRNQDIKKLLTKAYDIQITKDLSEKDKILNKILKINLV